MRSSLITAGVRLATAVGVVMLSTSCGGSPDDGETAEEALADSASGAAAVDTLYVSDFVGGTNRVQRFAATTGAYLGALDPTNIGGLNGPTGLVFRRTRADKRGELLANNQNVSTNINGDVKEYSTVKGTFVRGLVPPNPDGPFNPQGIVYRDGIVYVADLGSLGEAVPDVKPGRIARYDAATGAFLGNLSIGSFPADKFNPRALVFGPDGKLYVSIVNGNDGNVVPGGGAILRFDASLGVLLDVFVDSASCGCDLNRPQGVAFGPDGRLYVASFRLNASDNDKILIFNGSTGAFVDRIDLDRVGGNRAFAQAFVFGPAGRLFVPITGGGPDTGAVRRYNVATKTFDALVPPHARGGVLGQPVFPVFCNTDPSTLAYIDDSLSALRCTTHPPLP